MDYIALPVDVGAKHVRIPFAASHSLDINSLFGDFPEQCGFRIAGRFELRNRTPANIADFVQSWLYFGLISELIGQEINPSEFSSLDEQQQPVVHLGPLRETLEDAVNSYDNLRSGHSQQYKPVIFTDATRNVPRPRRRYLLTRTHVLEMVGTNLARIEPYLSNLNDPAIDLIILSIKVLLYSLSSRSSESISRSFHVTSIAARALRRVMTANGWCVHHWNRVCSAHTPHAAYYLATLPRRKSSDTLHIDCTEMACSAWNVSDNVTYKHTTPGCTCAMVGVSTRKVISIINSGKLPLVSIHFDTHGALSLKLSEWDNWTPYTAISHMWTEGLGNSRDNSLPQCQLLKLKTIIEGIPTSKRHYRGNLIEMALAQTRPHMFWLDSLCIPPMTAENDSTTVQTIYDMDVDSANSKAIDSMSAIYAQAYPTLVIDAEIASLTSTSGLTALLAYICYCGWTTRGWTLQEGSLPTTLLFTLADRLFDPESETKQARQKLREAAEKQIREDNSVYWFYNFDNHSARDKLPFHLFDHTWSQHIIPVHHQPHRRWEDRVLRTTWNALIRRRTSQVKDLPIVFANLLNLTASDLKSTTNPLPAIIGSLNVIPVAFLYNTGPRLSPASRIRVISHQPILSSNRQNVKIPRQVRDVYESLELSGPGREMLNAWVPSRVEGSSLPEGPCFRVNGKSLELSRSEYSSNLTGGCNVHTTFTLPTVPYKLMIKNPHTIDTKMLITTLRRSDDVAALEALESIAIGFCFLSQTKTSRSAGRDPGSKLGCAVLAIVDETPTRYRTIFYCAAQVEYITKEARILSNDVPTVMVSYIGPDCVEMLFNPDQLGRIGQSDVFNGHRLDSTTASTLYRYAFVYIMYIIVSVLAVLATPTYRLDPLRINFVVLLTIMLTYALFILLFRGRARRMRTARRYQLRRSTSLSTQATDIVQSIIDYSVNSEVTIVSVYLAFNVGLNVSAIYYAALRYPVSDNQGFLMAFSVLSLIGNAFLGALYFRKPMTLRQDQGYGINGSRLFKQ